MAPLFYLFLKDITQTTFMSNSLAAVASSFPEFLDASSYATLKEESIDTSISSSSSLLFNT